MGQAADEGRVEEVASVTPTQEKALLKAMAILLDAPLLETENAIIRTDSEANRAATVQERDRIRSTYNRLVDRKYEIEDLQQYFRSEG
jgi:hypothetical protein